MTDQRPPLRQYWKFAPAAIALIVLAAVFLPGWVKTLSATQGAVRTYSVLIMAANTQDLNLVRAACSKEYLANHKIVAAKEGGVVNLPRNINKNFQAWREGEVVYLCPTNREGPVYQFVYEEDGWKFDGPAGILRGRGEFIRSISDAELMTDAP